jgi:uncharacterized protein YkwD
MAPTRRTAALLFFGVLLLSACVPSAHADQRMAPAAGDGSLVPDAVVLDALDAMNAERSAADLPPLTHTADLQDVADARVAALSATGLLSHSNPDAPDLVVQLDQGEVAFNRFGENIGRCDAPVADVVAALHAAWMESPAHRANILDPGFNRVGIGLAEGGGFTYAAVIFLD